MNGLSVASTPPGARVLRFEIPISIELQAPFLLPGATTALTGIDVALARNADSKVIVPASHLKGVLRAACDEIIEHAPQATCGSRPLSDAVKELWGPEFGSPDRLNRARGLLVFGDLVAETPETVPRNRSVRVTIDETLGAATEGHLVFVESPWLPGETVKFSGIICLPGNDATYADEVRVLLEKAAERLVALGGMKSVGFGFVVERDVKAAASVAATPQSSSVRRLKVTYQIDRPFLVDAKRSGSNLSESSDVIPGSAIKAVLAEGMKHAGWQNDELLAQTRIGHAFANGLDSPLPLSIYTASDQVFCALGVAAEDLPEGAAFRPDWKDPDAIYSCLKIARPTLRQVGATRTAIDPETGTARYSEKDGGALFSQVAVDPGHTPWAGTLDLPDYAPFRSQVLAVLAAGCTGLGKTKAKITLIKDSPDPFAEPAIQELCAVTLVTPAALLPREITSGDLRDYYSEYFDSLDLTLKDFFAVQSLRGGFQALHFKPDDGRYVPIIMTEPGSVFLLEPKPTSTQGVKLMDALENGLKPHPSLPLDWSTMPFQRENGFGAVKLDAVDHVALRNGVPLK